MKEERDGDLSPTPADLNREDPVLLPDNTGGWQRQNRKSSTPVEARGKRQSKWPPEEETSE
jgi:hypothetical protein